MSESLDRTQIRRQLHAALKAADTPPQQATLIETAATIGDYPEEAVEAELGKLEAEGFVYVVDGEVKVA